MNEQETIAAGEAGKGTAAGAAPHCWAVGDSVVIADHSEAHGDKGRVDHIQANGIILVELEQGCIWPVTADELQPNAHLSGGTPSAPSDCSQEDSR